MDRIWGRPLTTALVAVALLTGCSDADAGGTTAETEPSDTQSQLADGDARILEELGESTSAWNRTTAPLVEAYLDSSVGADEWAGLAGDSLTELRPLAATINALTIGVTDEGLRGLLERLADNYDEKLGLFAELKAAVEAGDVEAEQQAAAELTDAGLAGREVASDLVSYLRRDGFDADALIASVDAANENLDAGPADTSEERPANEAVESESDETFAEVTDATDQLYVEVPELWSDIDRAPFDDYPGLIASNDRDSMFAGNSPGLIFSVVAGGQDHEAMLEDFRPYESCASTESETYEDSFYGGIIEYATDCGTGLVNDGIVVVASPPDDDMTLVVAIQYLEGIHDEQVQRILDSFQVLTE